MSETIGKPKLEELCKQIFNGMRPEYESLLNIHIPDMDIIYKFDGKVPKFTAMVLSNTIAYERGDALLPGISIINSNELFVYPVALLSLGKMITEYAPENLLIRLFRSILQHEFYHLYIFKHEPELMVGWPRYKFDVEMKCCNFSIYCAEKTQDKLNTNIAFMMNYLDMMHLMQVTKFTKKLLWDTINEIRIVVNSDEFKRAENK